MIVVPAAIPGPLIGVPMVRDPHSIVETVRVLPTTVALNVAQGGAAFIVAPFNVIEEAARPIAIPGYRVGVVRALEIVSYVSTDDE